MIKAAQKLKTAGIVFVVLALASAGLLFSAPAKGALNYQGMTEEIGVYLNEALSLYKQGNIQEAKQKAQAAYFEVFENLEGPIRINISARKNYELEEEFVAIRKMIVAKEPALTIEKRINAFMAELRSVTAQLEGGFELVAEATEETRQGAVTGDKAGSPDIAPAWQQAFAKIQAGLESALETYRRGEAGKAVELVTEVQFDGYKNSLLETAVRRHISQRKDFENNSGFAEIAALMQKGNAPEQVARQIAGLINELKDDLPGLPVVEGAIGKREAEKAAATDSAARDWSQVTAALFQQLVPLK